MQVCNSVQTNNHVSTAPLSFLQVEGKNSISINNKQYFDKKEMT